jgi:hypothetical protein
LAENLPLNFAQGVAEDFARKEGIEAFFVKNAPWRRRRASKKQRAALIKMRIPFHEAMTAGEAADLISKRIASGLISKRIAARCI